MTKNEPWLERTLEHLAQINAIPPAMAPPLSMSLRERTKPAVTPSEASVAPPALKATKRKPKEKAPVKQEQDASVTEVPAAHPESAVEEYQTVQPVKKLPRVILKLSSGPAKEESSAD